MSVQRRRWEAYNWAISTGVTVTARRAAPIIAGDDAFLFLEEVLQRARCRTRSSSLRLRHSCTNESRVSAAGLAWLRPLHPANAGDLFALSSAAGREHHIEISN